MSEKQGSGSEAKRDISPVEAYKILMERNINEDRLLAERTIMFLTASSILFLAFVMLSQREVTLAPALIKSLRIILSISGVFLTCLLYSMNRATHNTLEFLWGAQEKIERETPEFNYMREQGFSPQIDGRQYTYGQKKWNQDKNKAIPQDKWWRKPRLFKNASCCWLPSVFLLLWIASFIITLL